LQPDPLERAKTDIAGLPEKLQEMILERALAARDKKKLTLNSPELQEVMATPEGASKLLCLLLQKYHPGLSDQQCEDIYEQCDQEYGVEYLKGKFELANGIIPEDEQATKESF
jgi:hypothetical protein